MKKKKIKSVLQWQISPKALALENSPKNVLIWIHNNNLKPSKQDPKNPKSEFGEIKWFLPLTLFICS